MILFDRMYGELKFPPLIHEVLCCPGLMRLREVRMANVPFIGFPSFTGVTRYEHSLGVCHLAGIFAEEAGLDEKDKIEVMLAGLYHDVATPPFGHAVEEVLANRFDFDHEEKLREIIIGKTSDLGGQRTQVFLGRSLILHQVCQSKRGRELGLDVMRIADLAAGAKGDPLGDVISSSGIDLDNIDNVIRAATAMGIHEFDPDIAETLAKSFVREGDTVCIHEAALDYLDEWRRARGTLYGMIYASEHDCALQAMLQHAMRELASAPDDQRLLETDWCLTDDDLVHNRLLRNPTTAAIVNRMRLGQVYTMLAFLELRPRDSVVPDGPGIVDIEARAKYHFEEWMKRKFRKEKPRKKPKQSPAAPIIIAHAFSDQRIRPAKRELAFMGVRHPESQGPLISSWILGVFTPYRAKWDSEAEEAFRSSLTEHYEVRKLLHYRQARGRYPDIRGI